MTDLPLRAQLAAIREACHHDLERVVDERRRLDGEIEATTTELEQLRARLRELQERLRSLDEVETSAQQLVTQGQRQAVLDALKSSFQQLWDTQDHWVSVVHLLKRREAVADAIPDLSQLLGDYRSFDPDSDVVTNLPRTHRISLLDAHRRLEDQLAPYLELETQLGNLELGDPVTLHVVGFHDAKEDRYLWVLPYQDLKRMPGGVSNTLNDVVWEIAYQLLTLDQEPDWVLDGVTVDAWEGYDALTMGGAYTGIGSAAESVASYLVSQLASRPLFRPGMPSLEVTVLPYGIAAAEPESESVLAEAEVAPGPAAPLSELTAGWYSDEDVKSWDAPLKVVEDSLWNVQARRLRTLLIRMVARGHVEDPGVPLQDLSRNLPAPHREALEAGLKRLRTSGVLQRGDGNGDSQVNVTLDPAHLGEVQNLINREVTPFWAGIVAST